MTHTHKSCCAPARAGDGQSSSPASHSLVSPVSDPGAPRPNIATCDIPGGRARLGTNQPAISIDGEGPARQKTVKPFRMSTTAITNADFAQFIAATGHVTEAERFGWSFVFHSDVPDHIGPTQGVPGVEWWRRVEGATWRDIHGPGTDDACLPDHPVVHVSWNDAVAFAKWCGGRLPTEVEWEHAARGGLEDPRFPWGDREPDDQSHFPCNIWQGRFPLQNSVRDGWKSTAPARSFAPNGYGLFNMAGNVWEWTAEPFRIQSLKKEAQAKLKSMRGFKLMKGGSFLCHISYCYRYRIAARTGNSPDSTTPHQGFRVVWDH